jgi:hypothetical protein
MSKQVDLRLEAAVTNSTARSSSLSKESEPTSSARPERKSAKEAMKTRAESAVDHFYV